MEKSLGRYLPKIYRGKKLAMTVNMDSSGPFLFLKHKVTAVDGMMKTTATHTTITEDLGVSRKLHIKLMLFLNYESHAGSP